MDAVLEEDVGRPAAPLLACRPRRRGGEAPASAERIRDVDELVGGDRGAEPRAVLAAVVEHDLLVQAVAEDLLREDPVRAHVPCEQVDMVEPLHGGAAGRVALRLVLSAGRRWGGGSYRSLSK